MSLLPVVSKSQATNWGNGILKLFCFLFLFHWISHLIGAWLQGLFTGAHFYTRHLWKSKQRYQSMPFTSILVLAEITLRRGLQCYRLSHHISCTFTFSGAQGELKSLVGWFWWAVDTASQSSLCFSFSLQLHSSAFYSIIDQFTCGWSRLWIARSENFQFPIQMINLPMPMYSEYLSG